MLSKEQFSELRGKGLSVEQIVKFEQGQQPQKNTTNTDNTDYSSMGLGGVLKGATTNLIPSAIGFGKNLFQAVSHPIDTIKSLSNVAAGGIDYVSQALIPKSQQVPESSLSPQTQQNRRSAAAVWNELKTNYGSMSGVKKKASTDPVGFLMDASILFDGGSLALKGVSRGADIAELSKVSDVAKTGSELLKSASQATDPLRIAAAPIKGFAKVAGKVLSESLGAATGVGSNAIIEAITNPTKSFYEAMRKQVPTETILDDARDALNAVKADKTKTYKSNLAEVAKSKDIIDTTPVNNKLNSTLEAQRISINPDGTLDFSRSPLRNDVAAVNDIKTIYEDISTWKDNTALGLDDLRQGINELYSPTARSNYFVQAMATELKNVIKDKVPGYDKLLSDYTEQTRGIKEFTKTLSLGDKTSVDTSLRKLTSILKGNNEYRLELVKKLQESGNKELISKIAGTSFTDLMPSGLSKYLASSELLLGMFFNPKFLSILLVSSPRLVGELLAGLGTAKNVVGGIVKELGKPAVKSALISAAGKISNMEKQSQSQGTSTQEQKPTQQNTSSPLLKSPLLKSPLLKSPYSK